MKRLNAIYVLFAVLALLCWAIPAAAQNGVPSKVDDYVQAEMQKQRIPGVSVAVVKAGEIVLAKGYGYANVELQVPVKPETIFQSGSVGKQFTATGIMMLIEEGKLSLDDPITKYFSDAPSSWQNITVRHLLTHTAGTTDYPSDFDFRRDYTEDELLKRAGAIPLAFQPGEKWSYSNLGYVMLGILIHKVSGKFYGDFLKERIFTPLGMTTARIISEEDIVPNRAAGYRLVKGALKNQGWVSPSLNTTADGALYLTVYDMAKWDAALYTEKLLKKASLEQMWTPVKLNSGKTEDYGFGWGIDEVRGHRIIEHGGSWQGFKAQISRYVNDKLTVIVFANLIQANQAKLAHGIAAIYNPELAPIPPKAIEDKEPQATAFAREVLQKARTGKLEPGLFTPEAWSEISGNLEPAREFLNSLGDLYTLDVLARTDQDGNRLHRYRLNFKDAVLLYSIVLTKEGKIASLRFQRE
jgi:CubicO group peptidase (beta-lactamase class C family)